MDNQPPIEDEEMLPEYDFSGGVRGKHAAAYQRGYCVIIHKVDGTTEIQELTLPPEGILLAPDVRLYFKDAETVNRTLRGLIALLPKENIERIAA
jgi:hypothetical protein